MQVKSGKELMSLIQLSRTFGWSSTKAILSFRFAGLVVLALGWIMIF